MTILKLLEGSVARLLSLSDRRFHALLLAISFFVFLPNYFILYVGGDESGRHVMMRETFTGGLYTELSSHRPPLDFQMNYFWALGGRLLSADHFFFAIWLFFSVALLYAILRRFFSESSARLATFLFSWLGAMVNYGAGANERMYLPFLLAAAYLCLQMAERMRLTSILWRSALIGSLLMAATLIKQTAGIVGFVVVVLYVIFPRWSLPRLIVGGFVATLAGLALAWVSWYATGVDFALIWAEGYSSNLSYIETARATHHGFRNSLYVLGLQYLPMSLAALLALESIRFFSDFRSRLGVLCLVWIGLSVFSITIGQRYLQQYYINATPLLCFGACLFFERSRWAGAARGPLLALAVILCLSFHALTWGRQILDKNHYWDSQMRNLVTEIEKDTKPGDSVWLNQSVFPAYAVSGRRPAMRYLWFHTMLGQIDVCHAPDSILREPEGLESYERGLRDLHERAPRVIFWTKRKQNGCADRLKLENFPRIHKYVQENFIRKWESDFGVYFVRR
jgi:4-amino-4-deoxy-L-arabinose transferase-like glycosyltransferase